jgi:hypothetical protein
VSVAVSPVGKKDHAGSGDDTRDLAGSGDDSADEPDGPLGNGTDGTAIPATTTRVLQNYSDMGQDE